MDPLIAGFWGASFGTAAVMAAGAFAAFARSLPRVGFLAAFVPCLYVTVVVIYVGFLPIADPALRLRVQAMVFIGSAAPLGHFVLDMIGQIRVGVGARRWRVGIYGFAAVVGAAGWFLPPIHAFVLATVGAYIIGLMALAFSIRRAKRGHRLAFMSIAGVVTICISTGAMTALALHPSAPWPLHALASVAGLAYLSMTAVALWLRFSYLIELRRVMEYGAAYDPITRMRAHSETGQMVGLAFFSRARQGAHVGVLAITIGNLLAVEKLHGRAAANHALFATAGRLRRVLQGGFEAGRLGDDAFVVLARAMDDVGDLERLVQLGHEIVQRLSRPVVLSTSPEAGKLESAEAHWVAQVGVGIVLADAGERPSHAVAHARTMSRAAWGFPGRVAWLDHQGRVAEAPSAPRRERAAGFGIIVPSAHARISNFLSRSVTRQRQAR